MSRGAHAGEDISYLPAMLAEEVAMSSGGDARMARKAVMTVDVAVMGGSVDMVALLMGPMGR